MPPAVGVRTASPAILLAIVASVPAFADSGSAAPAAPVPAWEERYSPEVRARIADLDKFIKAGDYKSVGELTAQPKSLEEALAVLDWGKVHMQSGGGVDITLIYARTLWNAGSAAQQLAPMRITAGLIVSYGILQILADAPKCADQTAPSHRFDTVLTGPLGHQLLANFAHLPRDSSAQYSRDRLAATAIAMERNLAPLRDNDNWLCRGGTQEFADFFKKHPDFDSKDNPAPSKPSATGVGRDVEVPTDPTFVPGFVSRDVWEPKQIAARAQFPTFMNNMLDKLAAVPAAAPPSGK